QDDSSGLCHPERSEGSEVCICPEDLTHVALLTSGESPDSKASKIMAKKSKQFKGKKKVTAVSSQFDKWMDLIGHQIFQGNYREAVTNCERLLNSLPMRASQRVDVLTQLGTAQGMLQNFPQSYEAFSEALVLDPNDAGLWFNRSMASRFTLRFGRALRDVERAIELNTRSELAEKFAEALEFSRKMAEKWMMLRGRDLT